jgi:phosphatidylglycerol---prolipoprotein diacylglyceryl transferase
MIPELFRIGSFAISPFGVMMVCAFLAAYFQLRWGLRALGVGDEDDASALVFAGGFGGLVGAKVYYFALYSAKSGHLEWESLFDRSGLVWYGGFTLAVVVILWMLHRRRLPYWRSGDAASVALAVGYAVGRVGCFLVGDDYGVPTDLPWGVRFRYGVPPTTAGALRSQFGVHVPAGVPADKLLAVHPTQLYETTLALVIWLVGLRMIRRRAAPGTILLTMLALLAVERFAVEFLRAKDDRFFHGLTLAQLISVTVLLGLLGVVILRRRQAAGSGTTPASRQA